MAFLVMGSPMMVQLHCNGPTGRSRMRVGFAVFMNGPFVQVQCGFLRGLLEQSGAAAQPEHEQQQARQPWKIAR
jgi:hypothetical protein